MEEISHFERLLTSISLRLEGASGESVESEILWALEQVAAYFDVQRAVLIEFKEKSEERHFSIRWARPGISPVQESVASTLIGSWYHRTLLGGGVIRLSDILEELPPGTEVEKAYSAHIGIRSILTVPLRFRGQVACALAISTVDAPRVWTDRDIERASAIGQILANVIYRKQAEEALLKHLAQIEELKARLEAETLYLREEVQLPGGFEEVVGKSPAFQASLALASQVASTDSTVLLQGETGTGKEVLANLIHRLSPRRDQPFVKIHCPAIPASLLESELFGHERGAFTGADQARVGRFEVADGGTLFLDEIGELPMEIQSKLLQVLQDRQFQRLGSHKNRNADVRVIAATNRDLGRAMTEGRFRDDLYFRLAVFPITLPPLRERREDIPLLVWAFIQRRQKALGRYIQRVPGPVMEALAAYSWPGNIRELQNVIERALILSPGETLAIEGVLKTPSGNPSRETRRMEDVEKDHVQGVLDRCGWKIRGPGGAGEILGVNPSTLRSRMKKLGIRRP